jgi:hypothetical protein
MTPAQSVKLDAKFRSSHLLWAPHPAQAVDHTSLLGMILMRTTGASNRSRLQQHLIGAWRVLRLYP